MMGNATLFRLFCTGLVLIGLILMNPPAEAQNKHSNDSNLQSLIERIKDHSKLKSILENSLGPGLLFNLEHPSSEASLIISENEEDAFFSDEFKRVGFDGRVEAILVNGEDIYVSGDFLFFNSETRLNRIGRWDGETFHPLGDGFNGLVSALAIYNEELIAAGSFTKSGDTELNRIAKWNGESWIGLGDGFNATIFSLLEYDGKLFAGGSFSSSGNNAMNHISAWNGSEWETVGGGVLFNFGFPVIWTLVEHDGFLVAGGEFTQAGSVSANSVAIWDGNSWQAVGDGFFRETSDFNLVTSLSVFEGDLILTGLYTDFSGFTGPFFTDVMRWNGSEWSQIGDRVVNKMVLDIGEYEGNLLTVGNPMSNLDFESSFAFWNGAQWESAIPTITGEISSVISIRALSNKNGSLIFGGEFTDFDKGVINFAVLENNQLTKLLDMSLNFSPAGLVNSIFTMGNDVFIGGSFDYAGSGKANNVVRFTGTDWENLNGGLGTVNAFTEYENNLVAGGSFIQDDLSGVARWDGTNWNSFGSGLAGSIMAFAEFEGSLIAAGSNLQTTGIQNLNGFAVWDGSSWLPLFEEPDKAPGSPLDVIVYDGKLVAGGFFFFNQFANASGIGMWNGESFEPIGQGFNSAVEALTIFNGELIAGGSFSKSGDTDVNSIAKWNGENWEPLGNGLNFSVSALEVHNDYLFAGGNFSKSGNIDVLGIARWDGAEWNPVGSGLLGFARSLHSDGNLLHIGGRFRMAGNKPAFNYTTWGQLATSVDEEELSLPAAFELFQNYPNPFNPTTVIQFNLPQQDNVSLEIFNSIGQSVARLVNGPRQAGIHQVQFNASGLSSGVYFYRLKTNNFAETKKLTIIK